MSEPIRRLPVGIQSFVEIRTKNYVYVDKTDIVWRMVNYGVKFNYLSRPRRFGKSLLVDTFNAYFDARRDLFEGLRLADMETDWIKYPVIRLDMSMAGATPKGIADYLDSAFGKYEQQYGVRPVPDVSFAVRFKDIIVAAYNATGQQVAVLIDEYDSPLQHSWHTPEHEDCTEMYRNVFAVLKNADQYEKFVFITGITKFTQVSLFSALNNLSNLSFLPEYATVCGITEDEIIDNFTPEINALAQRNGWSFDEAHQRLKEYYDGYHFCRRNMTDIYNPFSLVRALYDSYISNYWVSSGATTLLNKFVQNIEVRLEEFDNCYIDSDTLESSDVSSGVDELFLFQSGYLTIKQADEEGYYLGFPNEEVKRALSKIVIPTLTMKSQANVTTAQSQLMRCLNNGLLDDAKKYMKALISDVPYSNKKMESMDMEERYRLIISTLLNAIGMRVEVERMLSTGRIDIVAFAREYIYIFELKLHKAGGLRSAKKQIIDNKYAEPFKADHRKVVALAVELDDMGKGLIDWELAEP